MGVISPIATDTNGQPKATGGLQELGKDDFLQLLITKMEHQDPLDPMDDEDYIAQLAQFSTLEQMNNIAEGIAESNEWDYLQMQSINNTMASGLIGKDVRASYSGVLVQQGTDTAITFTNSRFAENMTFIIKDEAGSTVATVKASQIPAGVNTVQWDGTDNRGNWVGEGYFTIEATATDASGSTFEPLLSVTGKVETITYREGGSFLSVNGTEIPLGDITAVGEPGAFTDPEDEG